MKKLLCIHVSKVTSSSLLQLEFKVPSNVFQTSLMQVFPDLLFFLLTFFSSFIYGTFVYCRASATYVRLLSKCSSVCL